MSELADKLRKMGSIFSELNLTDEEGVMLYKAADRIEALEAQLAEAKRCLDAMHAASDERDDAIVAETRRDALLEATKAVCWKCHKGIPLEKWEDSSDVWHPEAGAQEYKDCHAARIHKLLAETTTAAACAESADHPHSTPANSPL